MRDTDAEALPSVGGGDGERPISRAARMRMTSWPHSWVDPGCMYMAAWGACVEALGVSGQPETWVPLLGAVSPCC